MTHSAYTARRELLPTLLLQLDRMSQDLIDMQLEEDDWATTRKLWELFQDLNKKPASSFTFLDGMKDLQTVARIKRRMAHADLTYGPQEGKS